MIFRVLTRHSFLTTTLCVVLLTLASAPTWADEATTTMLILDASGSMWGQINGEAKIGIAKSAMKTLVTKLPDNSDVGLILYGHRRKGDCDDVELVIPPGALDRARLIATVEAINPKGKTPLARSIRLAAEELASIDGKRTVVLISDGRETCDSDACAAVKKLKASGVEVVLHVIGFDVGADERAELECIAAAGGGKYYSAADADELVLAASSATRTTVRKPASGSGRVWLDEPPVVTAGTGFTVHFEAAATFHDNAWIGVVSSEIEHGSEERNDAHDVEYRYINGQTSGSLNFIAPAKSGRFDVRMHDSDDDGREVAHAAFEVVEAQGSITTDKKEYLCGEEMSVSFSSPTELGDQAWIGLVAASVPHGSASTNDQHDVAYRYVSGKREGSVTIDAPNRPGRWTARLHDSTGSDGNEIAFAEFNVGLASGELRLEQSTFAPGETIVVEYTVPEGLASDAWVGIILSTVPHVDESTNDDNDMGYRYIADKPTGTLEFTAPDQPGNYDLRLNDSDNSGNEIAYVSFTVK